MRSIVTVISRARGFAGMGRRLLLLVAQERRRGHAGLPSAGNCVPPRHRLEACEVRVDNEMIGGTISRVEA